MPKKVGKIADMSIKNTHTDFCTGVLWFCWLFKGVKDLQLVI